MSRFLGIPSLHEKSDVKLRPPVLVAFALPLPLHLMHIEADGAIEIMTCDTTAFKYTHRVHSRL